ncbi:MULTISPECIES: nickel pincer cofactor biosynthesis protein LarC [Campylobacter]|uniref:Putative nickel insertion protein n=1 Tax=Campylobacter curvus (strain 525.92) TaxID=360105 RepID=A7H036_CAMC5|nr:MULTISPECIES: nickel pincer cofactor biosynthesis protein LarC [Campylobacter]EAU01072.1 putative protein (DUF111 domain) [Campylobacter curvus 525.92]EJP76410.1 TIGR00299 family protein [Campylobacter sp. FOBRC14]
MSKILYYDTSCGISGDMNLGALVDVGVEFLFLKSELDKLGLNNEFTLTCKQILKQGIKSTKIDVLPNANILSYRNFTDIKKILNESKLSEFCKQKAKNIFEKIAAAEAKIHGKNVEDVHFHEVGAIDSIVDIVGACICIEHLKVDEIISSKVELGGGNVECEHGILSVPTPAVCEILKSVPVSIGKADFELTTPTGAAILKEFASKFCDKAYFCIEKIGYGAGSKEAEFPNVLRVMLCNNDNACQNYQKLIQTNIDDMDAEGLAFACELLLENGALDVFSRSVFMKKGRIGLELNVLCKIQDCNKLKELIFKHTSSIGVREIDVLKTELRREFVTVRSKFGEIKLKISNFGNQNLKLKPEFDDCKLAAKKYDTTLNIVKKEILKQYDEVRNSKK